MGIAKVMRRAFTRLSFDVCPLKGDVITSNLRRSFARSVVTQATTADGYVVLNRPLEVLEDPLDSAVLIVTGCENLVEGSLCLLEVSKSAVRLVLSQEYDRGQPTAPSLP